MGSCRWFRHGFKNFADRNFDNVAQCRLSVPEGGDRMATSPIILTFTQ